MTITAKFIPNDNRDWLLAEVGNTEDEIYLLKETGKLFGKKPNFNPNTYHYFIALDKVFCGLVEYEIRVNTCVITNLWINLDMIVPFSEIIFTNLGFNFNSVQILNHKHPIQLITNQVMNEMQDPFRNNSTSMRSLGNINLGGSIFDE